MEIQVRFYSFIFYQHVVHLQSNILIGCQALSIWDSCHFWSGSVAGVSLSQINKLASYGFA